MTAKERAAEVLAFFYRQYPDAECSLIQTDPFRLLVAARLSAQCTDARVNEVCIPLFERWPDAQAMAKAELAEVEQVVRPCGLYHTKAQSIVAMAQMLGERFGGRVPDTMEELLELPGVGRKIANLILGDVYGKPCIVADTHCIRISKRLGLCNSDNPTVTEKTLRKLLPGEEGSFFCHAMVAHGRACCKARKPECQACGMASFCRYAKAAEKESLKK